jgi:hypothetical protein
MPQCNWILPCFNLLLTPDGEVLDCLLREHLEGKHLVQLSDGRFILWEPEGQCEDCPMGECECFDYCEISKAEANQLIMG